MEPQSELSIVISFHADTLDVDGISARLSLSATSAWSKGNKVPGTIRGLRAAGWEFKIGPASDVTFEGLILQLMETLEGRTSVIRDVINQDRLDGRLSFRALMGPTQPELTLDPHTLQIVADCGLSVEVDFISIATD